MSPETYPAMPHQQSLSMDVVISDFNHNNEGMSEEEEAPVMTIEST